MMVKLIIQIIEYMNHTENRNLNPSGSPRDGHSGYQEMPSQFTDISRLNGNGHASDNLIPPIDEDNQQLRLANSGKDGVPGQEDEQKAPKIMSANMRYLKTLLDTEDKARFIKFESDGGYQELVDVVEALMYIYASVAIPKFQPESEDLFNALVLKFEQFKLNEKWNSLFVQPSIFFKLTDFQASAERRQLDVLVLKCAIQNDLYFIIELIVQKAILTKKLLRKLLEDGHAKLIINSLGRKDESPMFIEDHEDKVERPLRFVDVIEAAMDSKTKFKGTKELIQLMKNELPTMVGYEDLFRLFVVRRKIKHLRLLFQLVNEFSFSIEQFVYTLQIEAYDIAALLYKEFFRYIRIQTQETPSIIGTLISSINKSNGMIEYKAFLLRQYLEQFTLRQAKDFLNNIDSKVSQANKFNLLLNNLNIVKTSCLLIELLEMISTRFDQLQVRTKTIGDKIVKICQQYMGQVEREEEMRYLLLEKDFEHRDSLDTISRYQITGLLETPLAENVVKGIWRSPYATNSNIFSASTNHRNTFNFLNFIRDEEDDQKLGAAKDLSDIEPHPLQFQVWRFSGKSRIIVDFVASIILTIIIHFWISRIIEQSPATVAGVQKLLTLEASLKKLQVNSPQYSVIEKQMSDYYASIKGNVENFYSQVMVLSYFSFAALMFAVQHIANIVYASLNKRSYHAYSRLNLLDFLIFVAFLTNILITYSRNLSTTWNERPVIAYSTRAEIFIRNYVTFYVEQEVVWVFCVVLLWLRVFYLLRFNEYLGKFLGILDRLLYDVLIFFGMYLLQLLFFSALSSLAFRKLPNYSTVPNAFKTLFYASFGDFSFTEVQKAQFGEYFGIAFMIIFLVCNLGLMMNLFIAIIVVLYEQYSINKNIYQMLETLAIRPQSQADKEYSAIVSMPVPLNVLLIFVTPFLLGSKGNQEKFNLCLLKFTYIPIMIVLTILYIVYNIVLWPFAYIKLFVHKFVMIFVYSKSYRSSRADKFIVFAKWVFLGFLILPANSILDFPYFIRHLMFMGIPKTKDKHGETQVTKQNLKKLIQYFRERSEKNLTFRQASEDIRRMLGIVPAIQSLVYPKAYKDIEECKREMGELISQYKTIKKVMDKNAEIVTIEDGVRRKAVDCKLMSILLQDMLRHNTVLKIEDEDYIFIVQATANKRKDLNEKTKEERLIRESKVRQKIIFKQFLFMNSSRLLKILKYKASESDKKRLLNSIKQQGNDNSFEREYLQHRYDQGKYGGNFSLPLDNLDQKVLQMNYYNDLYNTALGTMKSEMQKVMTFMQKAHDKNAQLNVREADYQKTIKELMGQLWDLKEDNNKSSLVKNKQEPIIEDYFGQNGVANPDVIPSHRGEQRHRPAPNEPLKRNSSKGKGNIIGRQPGMVGGVKHESEVGSD